MYFFDWFFGQSNVGHLKPLLISAFLGMGIFCLLMGGDLSDDGSPNKWMLIAIGFPIYYGAKSFYWSRRRKQLVYDFFQGEKSHLSIPEWKEALQKILLGKNDSLLAELYSAMTQVLLSIAREEPAVDADEQRGDPR